MRWWFNKPASKAIEDLADEEPDPTAPLLSMSFSPSFTSLQKLGNNVISSYEFAGVTVPHPGSKKKKPLPDLLNNTYGHSKHGEILSILGPSTLAQTKLLNVLAGRQHAVASLRRGGGGAKFIANESDELFPLVRSAIVLSDPKHFPTNTVEEEFWFALKLFLPVQLSTVKQEELVQDMLDSLNLTSRAKTQVRHLAKFELKRVAIGVELLTLPNLLLVDQPCVGSRREDWETVQILRSLQHSGICQVVASFHSPKDEVFQSISAHVLLMGNQGETLSIGTALQIDQYFASKGCVNVEKLSLADHFLLYAQYAHDTTFPLLQFAAVGSASAQAEDAIKQETAPLLMDSNETKALEPTAQRAPLQNWLTQFYWLARREYYYIARRPDFIMHRVLYAGVVMGLCAVMFTNAANQTRPTYSAAAHFGSFVFPILSLAASLTASTSTTLNEYKQIMLREKSMGGYQLLPSLLAKLITECLVTLCVVVESVLILYWAIGWRGGVELHIAAFFVMIEATMSYAYLWSFLLDNAGLATGLTMMSMIPQMLFLGTFARLALMPTWLSWLNYVCSLTWGMKVLGSIEFAPHLCTTPAICLDHHNTLALNFTEPSDIGFYFAMMMIFFVVYRGLGFALFFRALKRVK